MESLPDVADRSIPVLVDFATKHGVELPFTNSEGFKQELVKGIKSELSTFLSSAELLTRQFIVLILALVIAVSLFANPVLDLKAGKYKISNNLYTLFCKEISDRFSTFYHSFRIVLGVQIIISAINTAFTSIFVIAEDLPHRFLLIVATFVCGLFPIIGNIISNTIIVCVALTISLSKAAWALAFLVVIHKLEYFLNSKIIGERIKNPMWLTLSSLIIGEFVMGIPGMILAPVILYYLKNELSRIAVE